MVNNALYISGKDFQRYLPLVMGPVMKTASMKPEVAVMDSDEMQEIESDIDNWQIIVLNEQKNIGIKTAGKFNGVFLEPRLR